MREAKLTRRQRKREWPYMTIDSRSVSCTWIHWCPIVYPLSVISFVFWRHILVNQRKPERHITPSMTTVWFYIIRAITIMIENYTMGPIPLVYLYYTCNYHYDRKLHNGSNSTSLFILTLRESYKLSDSRVILTCCCLHLWVPHFLTPAHGWWLKSCVTKCA